MKPHMKTPGEPAALRSAHDDPNAKPTVRERYASAASRGASGANVVIAAGMVRNELGMALLRLSSEFDAVRVELRRASDADVKRQAEAARLRKHAEAQRMEARKLADLHGPASMMVDVIAAHERSADRLDAAAEDALRRTAGEIITERFEVLQRLSTLDVARRAVGARATLQNVKRANAMLPQALALALAGKVLDVYLDEACAHCDGTGTRGSGYQGQGTRTCPVCLGTGHRRNTIGDGQAQRDFAATLLATLQQASSDAASWLKAALHQG